MNTKPQGQPYGQNGTRYSFGKLKADDGEFHDLMFVNRDVLPLEGQRVNITDTSIDQNKIKYETDKKGSPRIRIYGTGIDMGVNGGQASDQAPAASTVAPAAPKSKITMEERIEYGVSAVEMALARNAKLPPEVLASVYGSAMFALRDGEPLKKELVAKVAENFNGEVEGDNIPMDFDEENPFNEDNSEGPF